MCGDNRRNSLRIIARDRESRSFRPAASAVIAVRKTTCARTAGWQLGSGPYSRLRSSPYPSGIRECPYKRFEEIAALFVVLEGSEARRRRRQQAYLARLGFLIGDFDRLFHF